MTDVMIEIPGRPVPKQRVGRRYPTNKAYLPPRSREYEETVAWACRAAHRRFEGPVGVRIVLGSNKPLTGDVDNYAKSILDGMQKGQMLQNDRQVRELNVSCIVGHGDKAVVVIYEL